MEPVRLGLLALPAVDHGHPQGLLVHARRHGDRIGLAGDPGPARRIEGERRRVQRHDLQGARRRREHRRDAGDGRNRDRHHRGQRDERLHRLALIAGGGSSDQAGVLGGRGRCARLPVHAVPPVRR